MKELADLTMIIGIPLFLAPYLWVLQVTREPERETWCVMNEDCK